MHTWKQLLEIGLKGLFPPRCGGCNAWHNGLFCTICEERLHSIAAPLCEICGAPFDRLSRGARLCAECRPSRNHKPPDFAALRSPFEFDGPIREAIHRFKYENRSSLAAALAEELARFWQNECDGTLENAPCDVITSVPLHRWREYRRGYNQSELLARHLGVFLNIPEKVLLSRVRPTRPQVHLGHSQRAENVKGAFALHARAPLLQGQKVLLIDDVCTTGATLRECAHILKKNGADAVYALTLARRVVHERHADTQGAE